MMLNRLNLRASTCWLCDAGPITPPLSISSCVNSDEPFIPSRGNSAQSTGCDTHVAVHSQLDVIEETVEKTVEHLEAEVKGLLGQLEELAWNLPPGPFSLIPDLLGDGDDRF
ncbi:hypothetical protein CapIbe_021895 [Capra ibex]